MESPLKNIGKFRYGQHCSAVSNCPYRDQHRNHTFRMKCAHTPRAMMVILFRNKYFIF
uniref:Uncharacterized protein n=1 Tax=Arundo donax TaxID=35708 RepID=A0A0A8ZP40_ARUDO